MMEKPVTRAIKFETVWVGLSGDVRPILAIQQGLDTTFINCNIPNRGKEITGKLNQLINSKFQVDLRIGDLVIIKVNNNSY